MLQQSYLTKFGYLPESDVEIGNLRTEEQLREAIKNLQVSFQCFHFSIFKGWKKAPPNVSNKYVMVQARNI